MWKCFRARGLRTIAAAAMAILLVSGLEAADWPTWRGPNADGVSPEKGLPDTWSAEGENLVWKAPYGGRSTPIVLDGRVCVIRLAEPETPKKWQEQILCLDAETGKVVWDHRYSVFQTDIPHHRVGWASLAGDVETGVIYSLGVEGMMYAFDRGGKVIWKRSFEEEVGRISGFGGRTVTPTVDDELVTVGFLSAGWGSTFIPRHRVYALDKETGETVWLSTPGGAPQDTTYSVGVVRVIDGERQLIDGNADGSIYGIQANTGKRVWGFPLSGRGINSSVVVKDKQVFASHSEENVDGSTAMGRLVRLDISQIDEGKPKEVWRVEGFAAGYASPSIHEGILYHVDNSANLTAFDVETGKRLWKHNLGIAQRASPVIADGKIFVSDVDGQFHILKLNGQAPPEVLDVEVFKDAEGTAVQINGSPAIANGRIYLLTNEMLYCIGHKDAESAPQPSATPPVQKAPAGAEPVHLQVVPAEIILEPGALRKFVARTFDAKGRPIGEVDATWSLEGVNGKISPEGELRVAKDNLPQGGQVEAQAGGLKGVARVSSRPTIPFQEDFDRLEEKSVPNGWNGARGRFEVTLLDGEKVLKKMSGNPRSWRTTVYIGHPESKQYVIEADLRATEMRRRLPDMGLVSHRYTLALMGNRQELQIRTWLSELDRFSKTIPFKWDPDIWYHMKMQIDTAAGGKQATVKGKIWNKGEAEPSEWTIEAEDALPHTHGSPGIYGYSAADIYYDNISVTSPGGWAGLEWAHPLSKEAL